MVNCCMVRLTLERMVNCYMVRLTLEDGQLLYGKVDLREDGQLLYGKVDLRGWSTVVQGPVVREEDATDRLASHRKRIVIRYGGRNRNRLAVLCRTLSWKWGAAARIVASSGRVNEISCNLRVLSCFISGNGRISQTMAIILLIYFGSWSNWMIS